jgi:membrane protease YdiL (CAAX protease family)
LARLNQAQEVMNPIDDNSPANPAVPPEPDSPSSPVNTIEQATPTPLPGDPLGSASADASEPIFTARVYPEDLQISWSWPHLIVFLLYSLISLVFIQGALAVYYAPKQHGLTQKQLEQFLISKPQFAIGSMLLWYAAIFFFLYVTLSVLRGHPFWRTLGWRKILPRNAELPRNPLIYVLTGCGLSLFVALLTSRLKPPENLPVEELFKIRQTALLFMAMAVIVAPLVEETLFRGYLYPLFARSFGVAPGIFITGVLFGLMHGYQLGWTWSLVTVLIIVGVIFTLVRARTGSVFASYLMHLGYNSLIAAAALLSTKGFTEMPKPH